MVTFKGGCDKLHYTQHTFLSNVGQLPSFIYLLLFKFLETNTHATITMLTNFIEI